MKLSKYTRPALTALTLVIFVVYFILNKHKFNLLLHIDPWLLLIIALADVTLIANNGFFTKFILRPFDKHIPVLESFYVSLISSVGNFFAPVGAGFGFRAVYLKRKFGLPYSHYISTLSGNYVLVFFVDAVFGLWALAMLRSHYNGQYLVLLVIFLAVLVLSLILSAFKIPAMRPSGSAGKYIQKFFGTLHQITSGWNIIISQKQLVGQLLGLTVVNFVITAFYNWIIIKSLHLDVGVPALMLFAALSSMSLFINITPANLGIKEAVYLFSAGILGFSTVQILSIALIDRGVMFAVLLIFWLVFSKTGARPAAEQT